MPVEREAILIENLRGCLDLYQRSIIWAMTASAALFLLSWHQFDPVQPHVQLLYTEINLVAAYFVALVLFFLIGGFALSAIHRAERNLKKISPEMHEAVLLYPSLATSHGLFRVGTVLFSPLAVLAAFGIEIYRTWGKLMAVKDMMGSMIMGWAILLLLILIIHGLIVKRVWKPFGGGITSH
jgi:hypothetical protein